MDSKRGTRKWLVLAAGIILFFKHLTLLRAFPKKTSWNFSLNIKPNSRDLIWVSQCLVFWQVQHFSDAGKICTSTVPDGDEDVAQSYVHVMTGNFDLSKKNSEISAALFPIWLRETLEIKLQMIQYFLKEISRHHANYAMLIEQSDGVENFLQLHSVQDSGTIYLNTSHRSVVHCKVVQTLS